MYSKNKSSFHIFHPGIWKFWNTLIFDQAMLWLPWAMMISRNASSWPSRAGDGCFFFPDVWCWSSKRQFLSCLLLEDSQQTSEPPLTLYTTSEVRNSWGEGWGDKGYFYMPYAWITQENLAHDFWAINWIEGFKEAAPKKKWTDVRPDAWKDAGTAVPERGSRPYWLNREQMADSLFWLHQLQCQCAWSKLVTRMFLLAAVEQRRAKYDFVLTGVLWLPFGWCFYLTSGEQTWLYKVPTFGSVFSSRWFLCEIRRQYLYVSVIFHPCGDMIVSIGHLAQHLGWSPSHFLLAPTDRCSATPWEAARARPSVMLRSLPTPPGQGGLGS